MYIFVDLKSTDIQRLKNAAKKNVKRQTFNHLSRSKGRDYDEEFEDIEYFDEILPLQTVQDLETFDLSLKNDSNARKKFVRFIVVNAAKYKYFADHLI